MNRANDRPLPLTPSASTHELAAAALSFDLSSCWSAPPLVTGVSPVRVRYEETDRAGVGYHANTFVWFECARTELLRSLGLPYRELEEAGWLLTVREVSAGYRRSVFYDELLAVHCAIIAARGARLRIEYAIVGPDGELRTTGHTLLACLETTSGRPRRLPDSLLGAFVEKGEPA